MALHCGLTITCLDRWPLPLLCEDTDSKRKFLSSFIQSMCVGTMATSPLNTLPAFLPPPGVTSSGLCTHPHTPSLLPSGPFLGPFQTLPDPEVAAFFTRSQWFVSLDHLFTYPYKCYHTLIISLRLPRNN